MIDLATILNSFVKNEVEFIIIGGVAATVHGSSYLTNDLDICYARNETNLVRLAKSLTPFHPRLRGAPDDLPFIWDEETIKQGLNFTLQTDIGEVDILGEIEGIGTYNDAHKDSITVELFGT